MTRTLIVVAAFLSLAVPTALAVPPAGQGKPESPGNSAAAPGQSADKNAAKKCKSARKNDAAGFKAQWGEQEQAERIRQVCLCHGEAVAGCRGAKPSSKRPRRTRPRSARRSETSLVLAEFKKKWAPGTTRTGRTPSASACRRSRRSRPRRELTHRIRNGAAAPVAAVGGRDEGGREASFIVLRASGPTS